MSMLGLGLTGTLYRTMYGATARRSTRRRSLLFPCLR